MHIIQATRRAAANLTTVSRHAFAARDAERNADWHERRGESLMAQRYREEAKRLRRLAQAAETRRARIIDQFL